MSGPTQTAETGAGSAWKRRPVAGRLLKIAILAGPVLMTVVYTMTISRLLPAARLGISPIVWWLLVAGTSIAVLVTVERLLRQFTPVAALMMLSVTFPDEAPSRFGHALRSGTVTQLAKLRDDHLANGRFTDETTYSQYLLALADAIGQHDRLTRGHSERVRAYADLIAEELELSDLDRRKLHWSALLHDVGKLDVPAEILQKPTRPTTAEWQIIQAHPAAARAYLAPLEPWLGEWLGAADEHHCRFDGTGYPTSSEGRSISLAGRIVAVADAFDVMTSKRTYKEPLAPEDARAEILRCAGSQFDPVVVKAFLNVGVRRLGLKASPLAWLGQLAGVDWTAFGGSTSGIGTVAAGSSPAAGAAGGGLPSVVSSLGSTALAAVPQAAAATVIIATGAVDVDPGPTDPPAIIAYEDDQTSAAESSELGQDEPESPASSIPETSTTSTTTRPTSTTTTTTSTTTTTTVFEARPTLQESEAFGDVVVYGWSAPGGDGADAVVIFNWSSRTIDTTGWRLSNGLPGENPLLNHELRTQSIDPQEGVLVTVGDLDEALSLLRESDPFTGWIDQLIPGDTPLATEDFATALEQAIGAGLGPDQVAQLFDAQFGLPIKLEFVPSLAGVAVLNEEGFELWLLDGDGAVVHGNGAEPPVDR